MSAPHDVVIIGSGFGGIGLAIRLVQEGFGDIAVLEKADDLGGTWRDNTYPGAACDIPSLLYSFSFEPKTDWSRRFPPQAEILDYLRACARKHGIMPLIRFGTEVTEARFDEDAGLWHIDTGRGDTLSARVLVSACGQLNRPVVPPIPGQDAFTGTSFHSARWDHDAELDGRRVAIIGTGASAVQIVPEVARRAGHLTVFQRSAPYVIDKPDRPYRAWERALLRTVPGLYALGRARVYAVYEARALGFIRYPAMMKLIVRRWRTHMHRQIPDPGLRRRLVPDYPAGCKRILISDDYYPALTRPNVDLVTERIERITPDGVRTADGREHPADVIVYATGFATSGFVAPMKITGRDGRELNEEWREGALAHLGMTVHGFPNFFLLYGPYTNLGHNSIIYMLESQFRYVLGCVRRLREENLAWLEVRSDVQDAFGREMDARLRATVWDSGCTSWYMTENGKVVNNWPGFTFAYRRATRRPDPAHFHARRAAGG